MKNVKRIRLCFYTLVLIAYICVGLNGCKSKDCPAFHEAQRTGGSIDKNKRNKRNKTQKGLFDKRTKKRYKMRKR